MGQFAAELFGRQEAQQLLDRVSQEMPKLTEDLVPGVVTLTTLHKVLQNLLDEKVPIRDMRTILETLAEHAPLQNDPHELTAVVRVALGRAITQQWFPGNEEVQVIGLDTPLERLLLQALQGGGGLEPGLQTDCWPRLRKRCPDKKCWVRRRSYWLITRCVRYWHAFYVAVFRNWWCYRTWSFLTTAISV
ncbi:flagellar biosynthesis protein FlhA [Citrobacter freundii]|nr:flagellar biosynthesis protein FlhA [Citrobacter freundii]